MKHAIFFRRMKNTKYSFTPLIASLEKTAYMDQIDLLHIQKIEDILAFDGKYQEIVIAFSFMTFDLDQILHDLEVIRSLHLKTPLSIVAGGPHVSGDPTSGQVLGFDSIFIGDGEATIREFCEDLLNGTRKKVYDGTLHPVDLRDYPPFPIEKRKIIIPIEISRGCPFGCRYCAVSYLYGRKTRHRDIDQILEYSRWAVEQEKGLTRFISPNAFGFQSTNGVTPNLQAIEQLLAGLIEVGMREIYFGTFPSDVRPESVTPEVLHLIRKYCANESLVIGAQSGSEHMLTTMQRGHDLETAERAISLTRQFELIPVVDFIFGLPGETPDDRKATIDWMEKITARYGAIVHAHTFMPLVGTPWAHLDPDPVDSATLQTLGRFSKDNQLFGYWARQRKLAERIKKWRSLGLITPTEGCNILK